MRDLIITLIVFCGIPFTFVEPIAGLLMWAWLSYMTPYRLAWGFARDFPFVMFVALATLASMLVARHRLQRFPWTPTTTVWAIFLVWLSVATAFAIYPHAAFGKWEEVMKIQLMVLVTLLLVRERQHLDWVIWVAVISIGFYGVKGGIFTILTGGQYHVWGPAGSWIGDNNELGAAVLLVMPLMRYLQLHTQRRWMWWGLAAALVLSAFTVLGTYSRGDFLGASAMIALFWWRSRRKWLMTLPLIVLAVSAVTFMPQQWVARMHSTSDYKQDASAMGRINAWHMAINMAEHRPTGGGFESVSGQTFQRYAPNPRDVHAFHSIFFQILGDSGFIGLGLYLLLGFLTFRNCSWILRAVRGRPDLLWARDLAGMLQVGFTGFAVSAAFLSLAYYDLPYQLMACTVLLRLCVARALAEASASSAEPTAVDSHYAARPGQAPNRPVQAPNAWSPGATVLRSSEAPPSRLRQVAARFRLLAKGRREDDETTRSNWRPGR